ncbi:MAG: bifunctional demethylmenaquinone methyltransferase/2-methoxy-6-polyprenyl-1,4-benzoquinol methylase UbiE [Alphaproteobacteria bacterium]|nr:bifunctional demethylmenaquinone methyltransferase/2-methoxy-6-polyprenyl-1,4-benzoquinol methylase UbiE [Alphaproteobacteria bacterium]
MIDENTPNTAPEEEEPNSSSRPSDAPASSSPAGGEADFGYHKVPEAEKQGLVHGVFTSVAQRYDVMNDAMSLGIHRLWKAAMVDWLSPWPGMHVLDVAGGTGDIAFRIQDALARRNASGRVSVCDINESMIRVGRDRAINQNRLRGLDWVVGNAEDLPLPDSSVDAYTIAFGIRNVTHIDRALSEAARVLKPGGRFLCLEFSHLVWNQLKPVYDSYSFHVIPRLGQLIAGDRESYQYLVESIRRFPDQERFKAMIEDAGMSRVKVRNLTGGVAAMHSAWAV